MRSRSNEWYLAAIGLLLACASQLAAGQSQYNQEWIAYKQKCGIPAGTAYNDWVAAGSKCNSGSTSVGAGSTTSAEQLGTTLGNITGDIILQGVHNALHGAPGRPAAPINSEQQQRALAAQQLNNSGLYLLKLKPPDYAGAINEFQKALQQTPGDVNITKNLQNAIQLQTESVVAGKTSNTLGNLLGTNNPPANTGNVFNQVNLEAGNSFLPVANANALHAILDDAGVVDLSAATKTSVDPQTLKSQLDGIFASHAPASAPPDPLTVLPRDIEQLFPTPPSKPGTSDMDRLMDKTARADDLANSINQTNLQKTLDKRFDDAMLADDQANIRERKALDTKFDELMRSDELLAPTKLAPAKAAPAKPAPAAGIDNLLSKPDPALHN